MRISRIFILPLMAQPLRLGISIIISSLFLCSLTALVLSSWYAYILFLIYVGGLLVMFAYVAALSPNVLFRGGGPLILFFLLTFMFIRLIYFFPFLDFGRLRLSTELSTYKGLKNCSIQLLSQEIAPILVSLGFILLINLVVVVKICYYQQSSLRPFN